MHNDSDGRAMCLDALNQAIKELNGRSPLWSFLRKTQSVTLVDGTATYDLNSDFNKESKAVLIDSDSNEFAPLLYYDWEAFQSFAKKQSRTGRPGVYTFKSVYLQGKVEFYPVPDAGAATDFTVDLTYYLRLGDCTDSETSYIATPSETEPWLVTRSQALMAQIKDPQRFIIFQADASRLWKQLIAYDTRHHDDASDRFRLRGVSSPTGFNLIKIGSGFIVV